MARPAHSTPHPAPGSVRAPWEQLQRRIEACRRCPRLIEYCRQVGQAKRRAYQDDEYWALPVPNFGTPPAPLLIVGLAPGAHGANRTGRMFTGDQSGKWLYRAMHRAGLCSHPDAVSRKDALRLMGCVITSVCHCAPPANRPLPGEMENCRDWLDETLEIVSPRVILALGQIAWNEVIKQAVRRGWWVGRRPKFAHGRLEHWKESRVLLGCYHPSQQNTFTGRLTERMLDESMMQAARLAEIPSYVP